MLKLLFIALFSINLFAIQNIVPEKIFVASGNVQDIKYKDNKIYAATDNGIIDIFNINSQKKIDTIKIPNIKDFMQDEIPAKIYSIDILKDKILIVSQGSKGYRNISIYQNNTIKNVISIDKKYYVQKAYFTINDNIVFVLLSNQIGYYDLSTNKLKYLIQVSSSSFSDFMINEEKTKLATTDESGIVRIININDGKLLKTFKGLNLDKVYQIDYKNDTILTAGQDRKAVIYNNFQNKIYNFDFLLYSCALSKNANYAAIAYNEQSDVLLLNVKTQKYLYNLISQDALVTKILFIEKNKILVSSNSPKINYFITKE